MQIKGANLHFTYFTIYLQFSGFDFTMSLQFAELNFTIGWYDKVTIDRIKNQWRCLWLP